MLSDSLALTQDVVIRFAANYPADGGPNVHITPYDGITSFGNRLSCSLGKLSVTGKQNKTNSQNHLQIAFMSTLPMVLANPMVRAG